MKKVYILFILVLLLSSSDAFSAYKRANQSGIWNDPRTWVGNIVPAAVDSVEISDGKIVTLDADVNIRSVTFATNTATIVLNGRILQISGYVSGPGTFTGSAASGMVLAGSNLGNAGTINFTTGSQTLGNFSVSLSNGFAALGTNLNVNSILSLSNGVISTGANKITLGTSVSSTGVLNQTNGWVNGNLERWISNSTFSDFHFPVGTSAKYMPVYISYTTASSGGRLNVSAFDTDPGFTNTNSIMDAGYELDRYSGEAWWRISTADVSGGAYSMKLVTAPFISGTSLVNYDRLRVLKRVNSSSAWSVEGSHVSALGPYTAPSVQRSGLTGFSEFGIGGKAADGNTLNNNPLPVTLKSFTSSVSGRNVKLNWVTEKEVNNQGFDIERIENGKQNTGKYEKVGFVESKGGNNLPVSYSFEDKNLNSGKYNYRLKQIDYNGNYEYFELSGLVNVGIPGKFDLSQNYPNPFNPSTKINFDLPQDGNADIRIFDVTGREVAVLMNEFRTAGYHTVTFDASKLPSGLYFYRLNSGSFSSVKKMILVK